MRAIITGVSGQDGYYMSKKLLDNDIEVFGLTTNKIKAVDNLADLIAKGLKLIEFNYESVGAINNILDDIEPNFIFNFAAKASGQGMFDNPPLMGRVNGSFVVDILEGIWLSNRKQDIVFCQASSSEMFGDVDTTPQTEKTAFNPKSPYGAAKLYAHNMVKIYRNAFDINCCSAIFYNHESIRRPIKFVTKKIANGVAKIKLGHENSLHMGSLSAMRDWGYAPEYMDALFKMVNAEKLDDYIIATGQLNSVRNLCEFAFSSVDLDYKDHVECEEIYNRRIESRDLLGNPSKILEDLQWRSETSVSDVMTELVQNEIQILKSN